MNLMQMISLLRAGSQEDAMKMLMGNNQAMQNPMFKNAMNMFQNHDMNGLQSMAQNLCKERGTTIEEMRKQLGI